MASLIVTDINLANGTIRFNISIVPLGANPVIAITDPNSNTYTCTTFTALLAPGYYVANFTDFSGFSPTLNASPYTLSYADDDGNSASTNFFISLSLSVIQVNTPDVVLSATTGGFSFLVKNYTYSAGDTLTLYWSGSETYTANVSDINQSVTNTIYLAYFHQFLSTNSVPLRPDNTQQTVFTLSLNIFQGSQYTCQFVYSPDALYLDSYPSTTINVRTLCTENSQITIVDNTGVVYTNTTTTIESSPNIQTVTLNVSDFPGLTWTTETYYYIILQGVATSTYNAGFAFNYNPPNYITVTSNVSTIAVGFSLPTGISGAVIIQDPYKNWYYYSNIVSGLLTTGELAYSDFVDNQNNPFFPVPGRTYVMALSYNVNGFAGFTNFSNISVVSVDTPDIPTNIGFSIFTPNYSINSGDFFTLSVFTDVYTANATNLFQSNSVIGARFNQFSKVTVPFTPDPTQTTEFTLTLYISGGNSYSCQFYYAPYSIVPITNPITTTFDVLTYSDKTGAFTIFDPVASVLHTNSNTTVEGNAIAVQSTTVDVRDFADLELRENRTYYLVFNDTADGATLGGIGFTYYATPIELSVSSTSTSITVDFSPVLPVNGILYINDPVNNWKYSRSIFASSSTTGPLALSSFLDNSSNAFTPTDGVTYGLQIFAIPFGFGGVGYSSFSSFQYTAATSPSTPTVGTFTITSPVFYGTGPYT
ncbi:MAG: hypothetical protein EBT07_04945, partial [Actinobacteria bacterium]|nr:hypothetical protein [Actinomycetota bacterium]